MYQVLKISVIP